MSTAHYDAVVVGAGLGGLTAAAYLARSGRSVLVCDQNEQPGGLATTVRSDGFALSHCPFLLWGAYPGGWSLDILQDLGIRDEVPLLPVDPLNYVVFPDRSYTVPASGPAWLGVLSDEFPDQAPGLKTLFADLDVLVDEWHLLSPDLSDIPPWSRMSAVRSLTFEQYLDQFIARDKRLRALLSASWSHWGLPPSRVSGLLAALLVGFAHRGLMTLQGGPSVLSEALMRAVQRAGGEVRLSTPVEKILVEAERAVGVLLADGSQVTAGSVVSNAPAPHTFLDLVGRERLPASLVRQLATLQPSMSAFQVYLGTDLDLGAIPDLAVETVVLCDYDQEEVFGQAIQGQFDASFSIFSYSLIDSTAAPPGTHCLKLMGPGPHKRRSLDWARDKDVIAARMIKAAERVIPGLANHIVWQQVATPVDLERLTNARGAAIYGWSATPEQIGPGRMPRRTPIDGLYLAGGWTGPFAGMDLCMLSGRETAALLTREHLPGNAYSWR